MKTTLLVLALGALLFGCDRAGGNGDTNGPSCGATTVVFAGQDAYDSLVVDDGFVYVELPGRGVARCPVTGCASPATVVDSEAFVASAPSGASVLYATEIASDDGDGVVGSLRTVGVDGSGDQSLQDGLTYPAFVAPSGTRTFWAEDSFAIDETPATIGCVGCGSATSTPWFHLPGGTYGMLADDKRVYVLGDDAAQTSLTLYSCSVDAPCFSEPWTVIAGLPATTTIQEVATDGTNVFVARASDVVRVDGAGTVTTVLQIPGVTALVVDRAAGNLYYGSWSGNVGRVKTDGTGDTALGCAAPPIAGMDLDAASLYLLTGVSSSTVAKMSK